MRHTLTLLSSILFPASQADPPQRLPRPAPEEGGGQAAAEAPRALKGPQSEAPPPATF